MQDLEKLFYVSILLWTKFWLWIRLIIDFKDCFDQQPSSTYQKSCGILLMSNLLWKFLGEFSLNVNWPLLTNQSVLTDPNTNLITSESNFVSWTLKDNNLLRYLERCILERYKKSCPKEAKGNFREAFRDSVVCDASMKCHNSRQSISTWFQNIDPFLFFPIKTSEERLFFTRTPFLVGLLSFITICPFCSLWQASFCGRRLIWLCTKTCCLGNWFVHKHAATVVVHLELEDSWVDHWWAGAWETPRSSQLAISGTECLPQVLWQAVNCPPSE